MANHSTVTDVFQALGDPTRLAVVRALGRGPETVSALAAPFPMALPSFLKHLAVLESSGVVRSTKRGRVRTCELVPKRLAVVEGWLREERERWEARSDRMVAFVEDLNRIEVNRVDRSERR